MLNPNDETWAKKGTFYLTTELTQSDGEIDHITFKATYGHMTRGVEISFTIEGGSLVPSFEPETKITSYPFKDYLLYWDGRIG